MQFRITTMAKCIKKCILLIIVESHFQRVIRQTKTPVGFEVEESLLDLRPDDSNDLSVFILCLCILLISMDVYSHNVQEQEICTYIRFLCSFKT